MKTVSRSLLFTALLAQGTAVVAAPAPAAASADSSNQRVVVPFSDPARPGTLQVNLIHGSIIVKGVNRKDVLVEVRPRERIDGEERSAQAAGLRQLSQPLGFTVSEQANRVEVESTDPRRACDVVVEVPTHIDLNLSTVNAARSRSTPWMASRKSPT